MRYPAILAAAAVVLGAATAFASPAFAEGTSTVAVKYSDLDLSTTAGQARLDRRIVSAARSICGMDELRSGTRLASDEARECFEETKARLHQQVAQAISRDSGRG